MNSTKKSSIGMSRRAFISLCAGSGAAVVTGCATNPVTGRSQLMLMTEQDELEMDQRWAPHQFSADYGAVQDEALNQYVRQVTGRMAPETHRPKMPYSARVVNSVVVNGYTFPAGSMGLCRGLMLEMQSEAELAALIGHEMGHVNARHTASRMSHGMATQLLLLAALAYVAYEHEDYTEVAAGLGVIGASLLLARYSRSNEREADRLGVEYAVRAEQAPQGMIALMDTLLRLEKSKPGVIELLFSTHPMSQDRYNDMSRLVRHSYAEYADRTILRERYMDHTANLRTSGDAIRHMQQGETALHAHKHAEAEQHLRQALKLAPEDYAGLLLLAKTKLAQEDYAEAERLAVVAHQVYPAEPQALHITGMATMHAGKYDHALQSFASYERKLPGNSNTIFFQGYCYENMGRRMQAVEQYERYLKEDPGGFHAEYVQERLAKWRS